MSTTTAPAATPPRPANAPAGTAGAITTTSAVAVRTGLKILRSPQILGIAIAQSVLFLLMFRYVLGRALADAALVLGVAVVTLGIGFAVGFRSSAGPAHWVTAIALLALVSVTVGLIFVWVGLASGSAQAANGLGLLSVPFSFLSSAFVPIQSMPGAVQAFAEWQPLTFLTDSWRGLLLGPSATSALGHPLSFYVTGSIIWCAALAIIAAPLALRSYRQD